MSRRIYFLSVIVSLLLHVLFFMFLFHSEQQSSLRELWSGGGIGGQDEITFIQIAKVEVVSTDHKGQSLQKELSQVKPKSNVTKQEKIIIKQKTAPYPHKKKISTSQPNAGKLSGDANETVVKKAKGTGSSDTPNSGNGSGLDALGPKQAASNLSLIRKKIMRHKIYPSAAKSQGITGSVKIAFRISENGNLVYVKVQSSSGHAILDDAALLAVKRSVPLPYYPAAIALTLEYKLVK